MRKITNKCDPELQTRCDKQCDDERWRLLLQRGQGYCEQKAQRRKDFWVLRKWRDLLGTFGTSLGGLKNQTFGLHAGVMRELRRCWAFSSIYCRQLKPQTRPNKPRWPQTAAVFTCKERPVWKCLKPAFFLMASRGWLHCFQTEVRLYESLWENDPTDLIYYLSKHVESLVSSLPQHSMKLPPLPRQPVNQEFSVSDCTKKTLRSWLFR